MPASLAILCKLCTKGRTLTYARNNSDSQFIWHVNAESQHRTCGGVGSLNNKTQAIQDTSEEAEENGGRSEWYMGLNATKSPKLTAVNTGS